jgi:Immunity protein 30
MNTQELHLAIRRLEDVARGERPGWAVVFDEGVSAVVERAGSSAIPKLLFLLNDESSHHEVMFSIVHGVESFDEDLYISELVACTSLLLTKTPYWLSVLYMRILNSDESRAALRSAVGPDTRSTIASILGLIMATRPAFCDQIDWVLLDE